MIPTLSLFRGAMANESSSSSTGESYHPFSPSEWWDPFEGYSLTAAILILVALGLIIIFMIALCFSGISWWCCGGSGAFTGPRGFLGSESWWSRIASNEEEIEACETEDHHEDLDKAVDLQDI